MESAGSESSDLIPGLPDDLALLCFAWLRRRLHPLASCVSRAWKHAFQSQALFSLRRKLGSLETSLFLCLQGDKRDVDAIHTYTYSWWVIDPALCPQCDPITPPPFPPVGLLDYDAMAAEIGQQGEVLLAATAYLDPHTAITMPMEEICRLDMFGNKHWLRPSPPNMLTRRNLFASASLDGYVYVAGGCMWDYIVLGKTPYVPRTPLRSAERLDCKTMSSWERLPDMHVARIAAGGVVLNGCFYVVGGYDNSGSIFSGEIWDPRSQKWILVPELWPYHIFKENFVGADRRVAVVMGSLFAIKYDGWQDGTKLTLGKRELMLYDNATNIWTSLGFIPVESLCHGNNLVNNFMCKLFGVGKELWLLVEADLDMFMIACSPLSGQSMSWRRLPYSFDYFILYLGIAISA